MSLLYPPDLVPLIKTAWKGSLRMSGERRPALPAEKALGELLGVAYHTSLLKEEGRKLLFRILYFPKGKSKKSMEARRRNSRLAEFSEDRELNVAELRRLAPAADSIRTMICVDYDADTGWRVWGLLDTGANWWQFTKHESSSGTPPPNDLAVGSLGPGELTISSGGFVLLTMRNGAVYLPRGSVLESGPVSEHFESSRRQLYREVVTRLRVKKWDEEGHDNDYPKRFYDMCLSRILSGMRELGHGGTLIVVPDELSATDSRLTDRINIKHPCNYDYIWDLMIRHLEIHKKYYDLYFPLWDSETQIDPKDYREVSILDSNRTDNDEELADCIRFIASLSSVDGALIITTRLRVLGFGAEVTAQSPTLKEIQLAIDTKATESKNISIEAYGTRHSDLANLSRAIC